MGKIIIFYNHKGGVGKTTLVHNLSFALADEGKRVLAIDADPQMNLTSALYGLSTAIEYSLEESSKWSTYIDKYISFNEYLDTYLKDEKCEKKIFTSPAIKGNGFVELISGSINLPVLESDLYGIIKNRNKFTEDIPYKFERSIRDRANEYDFVLIDTSPSASSIINGLCIMSCDYFITPVSPTFFSLQAIDNLSYVIKNWMELLSDYQSTRGNKGLSFSPKFLGIVVQLAKRFNSGAIKDNPTSYTKSTEAWINEVNQSIKRFVEFSSKRAMAITEEEFKSIFPDREPFIIEKCCDFTPKLRAISEEEGVPVIYLTQDICDKRDKSVKITNPESQYCRSVNSINQSYRQIAKNLLNLP
uniref:CobQ/CobB/MinD/ParA nucleotide binding domain-containing protein n=1 Tax=Candidatus Kentrum sp. TUN TaxID=2126343 RepID=A0A450ZIA3_9GAMM|nr:MAG: CobQ/CobB/MinD/ParA nucleotide binding domain-containing protein [Candidatus Kentron sp. TUN]VFK55636.1 MAG: CobQ/CobB/MinD/ParA nucleotide binding domain-containing protein [Candidatus Kentron sp. TUN]VFK57647.1 MAG: CobQ/CobB/MinD/ParA nucleotide binding domain-containing protein [Candidatus Kentron sp. TUN]